MANLDLRLPWVDESTAPIGLRGAWPLQFRNLIVRHLRGLFIGLVVGIVGAVSYLFPYKNGFLDFFHLPVLSAAYSLARGDYR